MRAADGFPVKPMARYSQCYVSDGMIRFGSRSQNAIKKIKTTRNEESIGSKSRVAHHWMLIDVFTISLRPELRLSIFLCSTSMLCPLNVPCFAVIVTVSLFSSSDFNQKRLSELHSSCFVTNTPKSASESGFDIEQ
jgi:hypothetical protein